MVMQWHVIDAAAAELPIAVVAHVGKEDHSCPRCPLLVLGKKTIVANVAHVGHVAHIAHIATLPMLEGRPNLHLPAIQFTITQ